MTLKQPEKKNDDALLSKEWERAGGRTGKCRRAVEGMRGWGGAIAAWGVFRESGGPGLRVADNGHRQHALIFIVNKPLISAADVSWFAKTLGGEKKDLHTNNQKWCCIPGAAGNSGSLFCVCDVSSNWAPKKVGELNERVGFAE